MAIGDPSNAPKNPKNLSISYAKTIPSNPAIKTTKKREIRVPKNSHRDSYRSPLTIKGALLVIFKI